MSNLKFSTTTLDGEGISTKYKAIKTKKIIKIKKEVK